MTPPVVPPGVRMCPGCNRVAGHTRRFCGGCRAVLVRGCSACGFDNELDDRWCGCCARALPLRDEPAVGAVAAVVAVVPKPFAPRPQPTSVSAGALLAINRRRGEPGQVAAAADVHDQGQLDALFGAGK